MRLERIANFLVLSAEDGAALPARHVIEEPDMLYYALAFLLVAIIAAVFGFGGIASASAGIAQILFFVFLVLFAITIIARALRS
jgi:uncharacterized membrane protein YtjA (UPF0391 family)